jgi:predicted kinase
MFSPAILLKKTYERRLFKIIKIIMGIPCSGKSTFIKNTFPNSKKIDLYDYQVGKSFDYETMMLTYEEVKDNVIDAIKNNEDFVLEHTLLKACRRKMYIDAIKEVTDEPIGIYVMNPSMEELKNRMIKRETSGIEEYIKNNLDVYEKPTLDEGFDYVYIIE